MQRLIILTDLWGKKSSSQWLDEYIQFLENKFDCIIYDSCQLAEIDISNLSEKEIHNKFIDGGIDRAVKNLLRQEKEVIDVLGFSIGGTIAWKAGLFGLKINSLTALSSSRIRYESQSPNCTISLSFGELDLFKPSNDWIIKSGLQVEIIKNEGHDFYRKIGLVESILKGISLSSRENNNVENR